MRPAKRKLIGLRAGVRVISLRVGVRLIGLRAGAGLIGLRAGFRQSHVRGTVPGRQHDACAHADRHGR